MQENHSFDNYFGRLATKEYRGKVDGVVDESMSNPDERGRPVHIHHAEHLCMPDPNHNWNAMHKSWHNGANDGFVALNGPTVMTYFDRRDIPYYYGLAEEYAIADRYFASILTQTYPNRMYMFAATSFGHIKNVMPDNDRDYDQKTIFDELTQHGVSWKYYHVREDYLKLFGPTHTRDAAKVAPIGDFKKDVKAGTLPQVAVVESSEDLSQDEHPAANIQIGQAWVADKIDAVMKSQYWPHAVVFLTYDEGGGFYDHVTPPEACAPDDIAPKLGPKNLPGDYAHYGFRVPFIAISPYAKRHHVSHVTYDHTSILKFIETKYNLPALTRRDANADGLADLFDYAHPVPTRGPIPPATMDKRGVAECGMNH
jgi:phospholipase C